MDFGGFASKNKRGGLNLTELETGFSIDEEGVSFENPNREKRKKDDGE